MRISTVILPIYRWSEGIRVWRRAEELGFHAAYTYDHLSWQSFRDRPWYGAVPTLTAAALATDRLRIGTLVTSPNYRQPVPLAKELMSLDDISNGRLTVGIGSGGTGFDATVLGQAPWSPGERTERFSEFLGLLDRLLRQPTTTSEGVFYSAEEARMIPGCVQKPRVPLVVAAAGPKAMALVARYGQGWVTYGHPVRPADVTAERAPDAVRAQMGVLETACAQEGASYADLEKILLHGTTSECPLGSLDAFVDWAGRYQGLGITEIAIHWPVPDSVFASDVDAFERIATEAAAQL
jgi:alkanesulfonate monooxygenase SsuD/methylene tetrahydromethanopterin reductase-like flavin-dependent oxidoreductase (luciferase family)